MSLIICGRDMMRVPQCEYSILLCCVGFLQTGGGTYIPTCSVRQYLFHFFYGSTSPRRHPELVVRVFEKSLSCMKHKLCQMESHQFPRDHSWPSLMNFGLINTGSGLISKYTSRNLVGVGDQFELSNFEITRRKGLWEAWSRGQHV